MATPRQLKARWNKSPGSEILDKIYSLGIIRPSHKHYAYELFELLEGLPFREEVPNGQDFRGMSFAAREMDLTFSNFSYGKISYLYFCILDNSIFDGCIGERASFHSSLASCSFVGAKLRSCYFDDSNASDCNFSHARLSGCSFQKANLRGARFCDADCRAATFANANLIGCDFSRVNLEGAVFCDVILDNSTNFRDAKMENVITKNWYDSQGILLRKGTDLG